MRILLSTLLFGLLFGACNGGQNMNRGPRVAARADSIARPRFVTLQFAVDNKPCLAEIDERYDKFNHKPEFPLSLFINVTTVSKDENGHPDAAESKIYAELERKVITALNKAALNAFIGKTTMNGYRDLMFYIRNEDQKKITDALLALKKEHWRIKEFTFEKDPEWEAVAEFYEALHSSAKATNR